MLRSALSKSPFHLINKSNLQNDNPLNMRQFQFTEESRHIRAVGRAKILLDKRKNNNSQNL
jgi:hypothetical protein